jgi:hypothetical protein
MKLPSRLAIAILLSLSMVPSARAQEHAARAQYPVRPRGLPEPEELALAMSAAPPEISLKADVYVLRGTEFVKARHGTNGCACMVSRDLHGGSLYPICFDEEAAKTSLLREMRETSLRARGKSEQEVSDSSKAALARGDFPMTTKSAVSYMMSPKQVLFSSPYADGVRAGAWSPHLMIFLPGVTRQQLGLTPKSSVEVFSLSEEHAGHPELIVKLPNWSDGTPAVAARRP